MTTKGSVTNWIEQLRSGNERAAQQLWERYFESLVEQGRRQLRARSAGHDEEDVALITFEALFQGLRNGKFPLLTDRHGLWNLLLAISRKKATDSARHATRIKRGGGNVQPLSDAMLIQVMAMEPTPQFAVEFADELQSLLKALADPTLALIATRKIAGYSNREIANELGCVPRTVDRKLNLIRKTWTERE